MNKIYTKTGDEGMTSIRGGIRVPKDHPRIEANGALDELNAMLGVARTLMSADDDRQALLTEIIHELMRVMSHVATPVGKTNPRTLHVVELTVKMEQLIDEVQAKTTSSRHFILPGGTPLSAHLQWVRTVCRRAERRLWTLHREELLNPDILKFINRLSDTLFAMARDEMERAGCAEEEFLL
ncbi:MAG: cob(I)yrinic acid a,c-diamide adenosyltransferase [Bacteroidaceae bacterium]|nr:cob(I)yrinic acid a,c-diamide adenosyltransferase [Bacteroidaceae bacterium]